MSRIKERYGILIPLPFEADKDISVVLIDRLHLRRKDLQIIGDLDSVVKYLDDLRKLISDAAQTAEDAKPV